jgi:hypothetical protein
MQTKEQKRSELQGIRDPERQARIGQLQDQPVLGRDLNPRTNAGAGLRSEKNPEIAIPQAGACFADTVRHVSFPAPWFSLPYRPAPVADRQAMRTDTSARMKVARHY